MTLKEVQDLVDAWVEKCPTRQKSELTNMAALTEEVGDLARVIAQRHGEPEEQETSKAALAVELADVLWALCALANQTNVDLTEALIDNLPAKG